MAKKPDSSLQLHYIDKVHATLLETGNLINRVIFVQTLVSLVMVALAAEVIAVDKEFSLEGLKFYVSSPLILVSGSVFIGFLLMSQLGLVKHEEKLRDTILRLYKEIEYSDQSMRDIVAHPLESPNIATIIWNLYYTRLQDRPSLAYKLLLFLSRVFFFALFLFAPLAAQFVVGYKVFLLYGTQWWSFLPYVVLVFSAIYVLSFSRDKRL
jgi:hypothetical protein